MDPAAGCLQRALSERPQHPGALANLGHVFVRLGRKEDAHVPFQQALAVEPGSARVQQALAALGPAAPPGDPELTPLGRPPADGSQIGLAPRPAPARQAPPRSIRCPECGEANPEGYFTCRLCGRPAGRRALAVVLGIAFSHGH